MCMCTCECTDTYIFVSMYMWVHMHISKSMHTTLVVAPWMFCSFSLKIIYMYVCALECRYPERLEESDTVELEL